MHINMDIFAINTIRRKILASFCLLAFVSMVVVSGVVSWKLRQSTWEQSQHLTNDLIRQTYATLKTQNQVLWHTLLEEVQILARRIADSANIRTAVAERQEQVLHALLEAIVTTECLDFAAIFDLNLNLQAAVPSDLNKLILEQYLVNGDFGRYFQTRLSDATSNPSLFTAMVRFSAQDLQHFGLESPAQRPSDVLGIAVADLVLNDVDEPIGAYLALKVLNQYTQPLLQVKELTDSDSVIYLDTFPISSAGFEEILHKTGQPIENLMLTPEERDTIYHANGTYQGALLLANTTYYSSCAALKAITNDPIGILCVMQSEAVVTYTQNLMSSYGRETQDRVQLWIVIIGIGSLCLFMGVSLWIATLLTRPLKILSARADAIAEGDLQTNITIQSNDEVGGLSSRLNRVIDSLRAITATAQAISHGDLSCRVAPRSEQDSLGQALQAMSAYLNKIAHLTAAVAEGDLGQEVTPDGEADVLNQSLQKMMQYMHEVASVTERIANNDLDVAIVPKSQHDVLSHSLNHMVVNLRETRDLIQQSVIEVERQNWLITGEAGLSNKMHGEQDISALSRNVITYLARYLDAQIGAIYVVNDKRQLSLMGSYAYTIREGNRNVFDMGEGVIGQAALEQQPILFTDVPSDYIAVASGLGETSPRQILAAPFFYEGATQGVIELGTINAFTELQRKFLEHVSESIGIAFHSAHVRQQMQALLEETQQQAEELKTQQDQLQMTNKALEAQAETLRASEAQLQTQQEELRQTNEELAERTRALEDQHNVLHEKNQELEKARQMVEEKAKELELASKYKSEFLANMSHELRTPLNSLLILSRLLMENKDGNLTGKQIEFTQTIYAAGNELLVLINQVLDLSKVEAGRMVLNVEAISLKTLASYVEQNFAHIAEKKGVALHASIAGDLPDEILTDRQWVEQIIKNLLSNAFKFTEHGQVDVRMYRPSPTTNLSRSGLAPSQVVAIAIADTGIGIPKDKQQIIFEAFQQGDGATNRRYGGTGLGLSIVLEFSRLLGGEIQVESEIGRGSTFTLFLPERYQEPKVAQMTASPCDDTVARGESQKSFHPLPAPAQGTFPPLTAVTEFRDDRYETLAPSDNVLLIIEDDPKFAKILFDLSRERGFKTLVTSDGAAGLQLAYQFLPRAILLDISVPSMDGWAIMEKLKSNPDTRPIPVHFISAQDQAHHARELGAVGYLTKPVTIEQLHTAFRTVEEIIIKRLKHLLIVEDDELTRLSMMELLSGKDVEITPAHTGEEAYQLLGSIAFDCMVLDLGLTDMTGFELLEKIAQDNRFSLLPIIVYTAQELTKDEEACLKHYTESIIIKGARSRDRLLDEVTLFLHRVEADLSEAQRSKLRRLHNKETALSGKRILIVDDDMRNVFALSHVLEEKGMDVVVAEHGKEALKLLAAAPEIAIVLMDMMMPEMDGYETLQHIRRQEQFKNLPIIALTAKAMKGDRQRCIDAGANDYLAKPVDTDKLLSLLRVWLY